MKNKNGITLIALIITIIVLLILAGVSISALVGDNGIVSQAMKAKKESEESAAKELVEMAWVARMSQFKEDLVKGETTQDQMSTYFTVEELNKQLGNKGQIISITNNDINKTYDIVYKNENENDYTISIPFTSQNTATAKKELYGMKIETGVSNTYFDDNWKIFYIDNENVYLIYGTVRLNWLPDVMAGTLRGSMEKVFREKDIYYDEDGIEHIEDAESVGDDYFLDPIHWQEVSDLLTENGSIFSEKNVIPSGAPTLEMWINSWNEKNLDNLNYEEILESGISSEEMSSRSGYDFGSEDVLYYANTPYIFNSSKYVNYFLATPGEGINSFFIINKEGEISPGRQGAVRPVAIISISDFQDATGISWN